LASAELAAISAILGKLPTPEEYLKYHKEIPSSGYAYLNFNEKEQYIEASKDITIDADVMESAKKSHAAFVAQ